MDSDDELPLNEQFLAEDTAPTVVSDLIRTKEDALRIHRVIKGHVEVTDVGRTQCRSIRGLLEQWDSPIFDDGYAKRIDTECDELDVLFREHNEMMELAAVRIPLFAIAIAARRHADELVRTSSTSNAEAHGQHASQDDEPPRMASP